MQLSIYPHCLPYISLNFSLKNLVFHQTSPGQYTLIDKFSSHYLYACYCFVRINYLLITSGSVRVIIVFLEGTVTNLAI